MNLNNTREMCKCANVQISKCANGEERNSLLIFFGLESLWRDTKLFQNLHICIFSNLHIISSRLLKEDPRPKYYRVLVADFLFSIYYKGWGNLFLNEPVPFCQPTGRKRSRNRSFHGECIHSTTCNCSIVCLLRFFRQRFPPGENYPGQFVHSLAGNCRPSAMWKLNPCDRSMPAQASWSLYPVHRPCW